MDMMEAIKTITEEVKKFKDMLSEVDGVYGVTEPTVTYACEGIDIGASVERGGCMVYVAACFREDGGKNVTYCVQGGYTDVDEPEYTPNDEWSELEEIIIRHTTL